MSKRDFEKLLNCSNSKQKKLIHLIFNGIDRNKRGYLTFAQVADTFAILTNGDFHQQIEILFDIFDRDGNGVICKNEIKKVIVSYYDDLRLPKKCRKNKNSPKEKSKEFIRNFDLNVDNLIDRTEFFENFFLNINYSSHILK